MKIGFLAMSGIRAHDPELLRARADAARVRRAQQDDRVAAEPRPALPRRRARRRGTSCATSRPRRTARSRPRSTTCDLVAISTFSAQVFEAYAIADRLRAAGVKVAMGGLHVSVRPDEAAQHADYVIVGEGENVWPAVVDARRTQRCAAAQTFDSQRFPAGRRREAPDPALRPARRPAVQPLHRADLARLPVAVRLLRVERHARPQRTASGRSSTSSATSAAIKQLRAAAVHRVRRRQHLRRQGVGQGAVPPARAAATSSGSPRPTSPSPTTTSCST